MEQQLQHLRRTGLPVVSVPTTNVCRELDGRRIEIGHSKSYNPVLEPKDVPIGIRNVDLDTVLDYLIGEILRPGVRQAQYKQQHGTDRGNPNQLIYFLVRGTTLVSLPRFLRRPVPQMDGAPDTSTGCDLSHLFKHQEAPTSSRSLM